MKYPEFLVEKDITVFPVINVSTEPYVLDFSDTSELVQSGVMDDQAGFQAWLANEIPSKGHEWGLSDYLEYRGEVLKDVPQMAKDGRFYHLGIDIIVDKDTPLYAPLPAVVEKSGHEDGEGNYGGYVLLKHSFGGVEPFYSLFGHLKLDSLPKEGKRFGAGEIFAETGDFHENGGWFYHTHMQIITEEGLKNGYLDKGYCSEYDLKDMEKFCPNPIPLLKIIVRHDKLT